MLGMLVFNLPSPPKTGSWWVCRLLREESCLPSGPSQFLPTCSCPRAARIAAQPQYWKASLPSLYFQEEKQPHPRSGLVGGGGVVAHSTLCWVVIGGPSWRPLPQLPLPKEEEFPPTFPQLPPGHPHLEKGDRAVGRPQGRWSRAGKGMQGTWSTPSTGPWGPLPSRNVLNGPSGSPLCANPLEWVQ